jgi:hypothetical protein
MTAPDFTRFAAIDWSGAKGSRQRGIAVALCEEGRAAPVLVEPSGASWGRAEVLDWLVEQADKQILIGLDLSPAFPFADCGAYFPGWPASPPDARSLWALVDESSVQDLHFAASGFVGNPQARRHFRQQRDCGDLFKPGRGRLRECERRQLDMGLSPSSCFNLIGPAQVGKSSLTGMRVLHALDGRIPVWPFDPLPEAGPVIVEIYTTIAARAARIRKGLSKMRDGAALDAALLEMDSDPHMPLSRYDDHSTDAILTAAWLRAAAGDPRLWNPAALTPEIARTEGWTFGVP